MAIRKLTGFEYKCDACDRTHVDDTRSSHYHNSTPPDWLAVRVSVHGEPCREVLLCKSCARDLRAATGIQGPAIRKLFAAVVECPDAPEV